MWRLGSHGRTRSSTAMDQLVEESGGDLGEAEEKFSSRSAGADPDPPNVPRAEGDGHS